MQKPRLSFWQIWNMSFGFLGIQFGWGLQLGNMSAHEELWQLYQKETSVDVKKRILQAMFVGGDATRLIELDRRTVPGETAESVEAEIQAILDSLSQNDPAFKAIVRLGIDRPPMQTRPCCRANHEFR